MVRDGHRGLMCYRCRLCQYVAGHHWSHLMGDTQIFFFFFSSFPIFAVSSFDSFHMYNGVHANIDKTCWRRPAWTNAADEHPSGFVLFHLTKHAHTHTHTGIAIAINRGQFTLELPHLSATVQFVYHHHHHHHQKMYVKDIVRSRNDYFISI